MLIATGCFAMGLEVREARDGGPHPTERGMLLVRTITCNLAKADGENRAASFGSFTAGNSKR